MPRQTRIGRVTIAGLPEVRLPGVKLATADCDLSTIRRINRNRGLVCGVTKDIIHLRVYMHMIADEWAELRDHPRRSFQPVNARSRCHLVFFERFRKAPCGCRLTQSGRE